MLFDSKVLLGNGRTIEPNGVTRNEKFGWHNFDMYIEMFRILFKMDKSNYPEIIKKMKPHAKGVFALHDVTKATLNHTKNGEGADAPMLFQQGRIVELFQYNLQDVRITKELFNFIQKYKYLVTGSYDIIQFK